MVRRKNAGANRRKCKSYDVQSTSQMLLVFYENRAVKPRPLGRGYKALNVL